MIHGYGNTRERTELIHQSLEDVNLSPAEETAAKYPHMLSGGQRQRVGIASVPSSSSRTSSSRTSRYR